MKLKALSLVMIASLLASMLLIGIGSAQWQRGATAKFGIKLPDGSTFMNVTTAEYDIGDKFNITVHIQDVVEMMTFGVTLVWNTTFTNATGRYWKSPAMNAELTGGRWTFFPPAISNDYLPAVVPHIGLFEGFGGMAYGATYALNGSYNLCIIEFQVNAYGPLGFYLWKDPTFYKPWPYTTGQPELAFEGAFPEYLHPVGGYCVWSSHGVDQPYDVIWVPQWPVFLANALLWIQPPAPKPPSCTIAVSPAFPLVNQTVTATVTTVAGFDGTTVRPVTEVTINWCDGTGNFTDTAAPFVFTHEYASAGTFTIKVWCYAAGMPPELAWCYCEKPITVRAVELTGIDVYQVRHSIWPGDPGGKSGEGADIPGRPYDPQSLVVLEAYVFYNGEPVQAKIVSFEVTIPHLEQCILYRTDRTGDDPQDPGDAEGIAWIEFRIPELCWPEGPEFYFGKWLVTVTVEMCEVKYSDTMEFDMGYILTLSNMAPVLDSYKKCEYVEFTVDVTNIDWLTVPATIILVVYDDNEVPIGQEVVGIDVPPGEFCSPTTIPVTLSLHIPKYAYVGTGIGYINLFTALPSECGLAYCPEVSAGFLILKT